ncbi:Uncharacterised protein [Yersinia pseudotuberculosis]|uniref:Transposase n=1 Tax=Yersinia wautersii TaxID=1341643 RepID=A0ABP1ZD72_9GAMM|nr:Uncharacterised protein [Yersinia pseudotuberculosis]CRG49175.1 Uncharacterised protein [Yersinia wautersii]
MADVGIQIISTGQAILAGIELVHMIRKGQLQHPVRAPLSPTESLYLLAD